MGVALPFTLVLRTPLSLKVFYCVAVRRKMESVPLVVVVLLCIFSLARGNEKGVGKSGM